MDTDDNNSITGENMEIEPDNFTVNDEILDSNSYGISRVIECELCQQMFTNKVKLTCHWIINHSYKPCQLCSSLAFKYDSDKIQHEQQHLPFSCASCSHEFNTVQEETISSHYQTAHGSHLCKFCSSVVNPSSMYPEHLLKKHGVINSNIVDPDQKIFELITKKSSDIAHFSCNLCDKKRNMNVFTGHFLFHHKLSIHAFLKIIEGLPISIDGTILSENEPIADENVEAEEDKTEDNEICQVCDIKTNGFDSKVHKVFCNGFLICKEKECKQLFKDRKELSSHVEVDHPIVICKFGCLDKKLKSNEIVGHLEKLHDIVECYMCDIVNSSGSFNDHLRDFHSVNITSYKKHSKAANPSKLFRVESISQSSRSNSKNKSKRKVLCNLCDEDITEFIREFSFVNHYKKHHKMKIEAIVCNLVKNPIIDMILNEREENAFLKHFTIEVDGSYINEMMESDFDTSKVSCVGNDDHQASTTQKHCYKCEFCDSSFTASCQLYSHLHDKHGFKLSNVKDYCNTCELHILKENKSEAEDDDEDIKDFNLALVCPLDQSYHVTRNNYKDHMMFDHADDQVNLVIYKCLECNFTYTKIDDIRSHFKLVHPSIQVNYCRLCRLKLNDVSHSSSHLGENHLDKAKKTFSCKLCKSKRSFKLEHNAKSHYETKHAEKISKSKPKPKAEPTTSKAKKVTRKSKPAVKQPSLKCQVCDDLFFSVQDRKLHLIVVHPDEKIYKCKQCPAEFKSKGSLSCHNISIHKNETHECEICHKIFTRRDSFKEHMLIHSSVRHQCGFCDKNFVQRSNLIRHERIHIGDKPYSCQYCPKKFSDKGACTSHENVHTQAQKAWCDICGAQYSKKQKLKYHMRKHSLENLETCKECGKSFTDSYKLKKHLETHESEMRHECQHCFKRYKTASGLKDHVKNVHSLDPSLPFIDTKIVCTLCNHEAVNSIEIEEHLKLIHSLDDTTAADWQNFIRNVDFEMGEGLEENN